MEMVRRHLASETGLLFCVKGPSSKQEKGKFVFFYCREGGGKDEKGKRIFLILCAQGWCGNTLLTIWLIDS